MQRSKKQQFNQSQHAFVGVDETTFPYLPKRSNSIGLSAPPMHQGRPVSSKNLKNYQTFGQFLHDLDPVAYNYKLDPRPRSCFNCWSPKHPLSDCPERVTDIFCCNCGRRYLKIDQCPRCSRVFWELDQSARHWLISYIPGVEEEEVTSCSDKNWSEYKYDGFESYSGESDSGKLRLRKGILKQEDLTKCESTRKGSLKQEDLTERESRGKGSLKQEDLTKRESRSESVVRATGKDESDNDEWWQYSQSKDEPLEDRLNSVTEIKSAEMDNQKSPSANETNRYNEECLHASLQGANVNVDCVFENNLNSLGESSSATLSDEEDYDNIIVDEDEEIEDSCVVGDTVRDFLNLLKAAKYLPLQKQNTIVLRFASECKKKF